MPMSQEELKAKVLADAETVVTAMLKDGRVNGAMTLSEMEVVVGKMGDQLVQQVMQRLVEQTQEVEGERTCGECGEKLRYKGRKKKRVVTLRGEVELERAYYVCRACGTSVFPPG